MTAATEIRVPDIGEFTDVPVIEVLVAVGDRVQPEQSLITLESDKATMEVPSPLAGVVTSVAVAVGDAVSEGTLIATLEPDAAAPEVDEPQAAPAEASRQPDVAAAAPVAPPAPVGDFDHDLVVLGSGPGGYTAAFRAADLGLKVALVERYPSLGGVCLNVGCIPSKALLHAANVIEEAALMSEHGVEFGAPRIDLDRLRSWKDGVVGQLTHGLAGMARRRGVRVIEGTGTFTGPHAMRVATADGPLELSFAHAIIAAGSQALQLPGLPWDDPRVMDSTGALALADIPARLLVIGGGIIGLEMASVYQALGSRVTVVELTGQLMPGADPDLVRPLQKRIAGRYAAIHLDTRVGEVQPGDDGLAVSFEGESPPGGEVFDRILVSVGRVPNGHRIGAEAAGVEVTERGFIPVDGQLRTNVPHIFAIGDIVGQPMLAHKATHEGKVAAEVCAGHKRAFEARVIPSVAYTDPEVAWVGLTEAEAQASGVDYGVGKFPWAASGRALGIGRPEGFTKLLFDKATRRIVGAGIVGPHAGDLIAECALAIEMGSEAADIGLTVHPHPTLSESVAMAAEVFEGTVTDLYLPRRA
ncbi:MAG: dihydrolipoyl dehydrogenase [Xanthomonadales bacterium]|nr:dihydrolipoyl dehydrogenase [Xanthomonadales bacterium]NIN58445.1 dihydrolipoyl dehydrogenase [Xanthomonadales bacterium]NIN74991.1 dihydrolipoyl dehydrogenase [Xanthomonadales bacterium]NIO13083.1 dihydrolipoyl dehydrogenase [Xanthomonadales bacterium]NIP10838.1 dihydrolipoyl dehydrogenase [Xanthomonadales bacterium]